MNIFRSRGLVAFVASAAAVTGISVQQSQEAAPGSTALRQRLDGLLADPRYQGSQVALVVRDAATGEVLYDRNGGNRMLPASNTKIFSSAAALDTLGPDFRFHTDVVTTAPVRGGKLRGDLYLKGYGDPTALESDYKALAAQVAASGIRRIDGDLVADGSGLSRMVNLTADSISDVLIAAQSESWFPGWYASMPIAGNPDRFVGGTLRNRMRGTPAANNVHAKTGSLTGVTALSGYVTDADGRRLVFSMLSNNYITTPRPVEDAVAVTLASSSEKENAAVPAITPAEPPSPGYSAAPSDGLECSWQKDQRKVC